MSGGEQLELGADPEVREPQSADTPRPGTTADSTLSPTAEQQAAIDCRDLHVFLEAGAGTGKTTVLVGRYCDAIDLDEVAPEAILAFTFTEKAAAEMKRRVRGELSRRADDAVGERRERLLIAARAGEAAAISTIHGFCRSLLAGHPAAAGLDPRFRVLDQAEASRLSANAFADSVRALAADDDDVTRLAAGFRMRLEGIVVGAYRELRNRGISSPRLPEISIAIDSKLEQEADADLQRLALGSIAGLAALLAGYGERYEELKDERSGLDFDDLQLRALELLREQEIVRTSYQERFRHLLVDEFQDTSPMQVELVRLLAGAQTRVFTVGDEFQAIYGFRGADLETFRAERERAGSREIGAEGRRLKLRGSFRSEPAVVAAINAIGETLLDDFMHLTVGREDADEGGAGVELLLVEGKGRANPWKKQGLDGEHPPGAAVLSSAVASAKANRIAEARAIARRLRELVDQGEVEAAETVVLLRAFTHVETYAEALERAGLDPYVNGGRGYWSGQQVEDGLRLLTCVENPLEDEALLGALACPAGAVSPDGLWILRQIAGRGNHLWPALERWFGPDGEPEEAEAGDKDQIGWLAEMPSEDGERLSRFHSRLSELRVSAGLLPLEQLVERTFASFGYDLAVLSMPGGLSRSANLEKLIRIAAEHEAHEGRDLSGFLANAARADEREAQAALVSEDHAGVRLMTIHAAKGLEFDTVVVADMGRGLAAGGSPKPLQLDFHGQGGEAAASIGLGLQISQAGGPAVRINGWEEKVKSAALREAEESCRLIYVAASRAKRRLLLCGLFEEKDLLGGESKPSNTALSRLLPALAVSGEDAQTIEIPAPLPTEGLEAVFAPARIEVAIVRGNPETAAELERSRRGLGNSDEIAVGAPPLLNLAERGAAAARSLSYAALADYERCGYRFMAERILGLGATAATASSLGLAEDGEPEEAGLATGEDEPAAHLGAPLSLAAGSARVGFGRAVHALLEWSARNGSRAPSRERIDAMLSAEGAGPTDGPRAAAQIQAWLDSPLLGSLRSEAATLRPEVPFRLSVGADTVIRGTIDLLAIDSDGGATVIDFKTGALHGDGPGELGPEYLLQRRLYAIAAAEGLGSTEIETAYVFLDAADNPLTASFDAAALELARGQIEAVVAEVRAGRFDVTPAPGYSLCHDCPARERLCSYPPELTMAG